MSSLTLHAVIFPKEEYNLKQAKEKAKKFIAPTKKYYREA